MYTRSSGWGLRRSTGHAYNACMRPFSVLAPLYDRLMYEVPYEDWASFVLAVLAGKGAHPETVLDLGCGTGLSAKPYLRRGLRVTGLDASPEMLDIAAHESGGLELVEGDFRDFDLGRRFDLVISAFDSLNNLTTLADLRAAFLRVRAHLEPGGWLVADLNTPAGLLEIAQDGDISEAEVHLRHSYDPQEQIGTLVVTIGQGTGNKVEIHKERGYLPQQVITLAEQTGFAEAQALQFPSGIPADQESPRFWIFAAASANSVGHS